MVYFLYGKDSFRALEFVKIVFKEKCYKRINFEDFAIKDIISEISADSLFSLMDKTGHFFIRGEKLNEALEIPRPVLNDKNKIIIFYFEKVAKDIIEKLPSPIKIKRFEPLKGAFINKFIENYLKEKDIKYDSQTPNILSQYCGGDLWKMATEVAAIIAQKETDTISQKDLCHLIGYGLRQNAFAIVDLAHSGKVNRSLKILSDLIQKEKEDEFRIVGAINWQIKNVLTIKDLYLRKFSIPLIQKASGLKDFVIKKSLEQSSRHNLKTLSKLHRNLVKLHFDLRRLKVAPQALIEKFIYSLR